MAILSGLVPVFLIIAFGVARAASAWSTDSPRAASTGWSPTSRCRRS